MMLADLGADVVRVDRPSGRFDLADSASDVLLRGRRSVTADLKTAEGVELVLRLSARADVLLEGFRPGVAERLGVGPEECTARNGRLVYGRITGWGQDGPMAPRVGHDLNYLGLTGTLAAIGRAGGTPVPPLNLVADFGGGSMLLLVGTLAALLERERSGHGQVVDAAMVDGVALLSQMLWSFRGQGAWDDQRQSNSLDGGAPFYDTYECADGRYIALAALEPQFYARLIDGLELDSSYLEGQYDKSRWPRLRETLSRAIAERTRDDWTSVFKDVDACVTPVIELEETLDEPHLSARSTFVLVDGVQQAAPAPRFSRSRLDAPLPPRGSETHLSEVVADWGL